MILDMKVFMFYKNYKCLQYNKLKKLFQVRKIYKNFNLNNEAQNI